MSKRKCHCNTCRACGEEELKDFIAKCKEDPEAARKEANKRLVN